MVTVPTEGEKVGPFTLIERIGRGGMGAVWLAIEPLDYGKHRLAAVKLVESDEPDAERRFANECWLHSQLQHDHLPSVYRTGLDESRRYLALELLEGASLNDIWSRCRKARRRLDPVLVAHVVACASAGLHHAHTRTDSSGAPLAIVHRDISPSNVFVTFDGRVKVIDFGIAAAADKVERTQGSLVGKFAYMSPEQYSGQAIDARADVWALGVVAWTLLADRRPFEGDTFIEVSKKVIRAPITAPIEASNVGEQKLVQVVLWALERSRERRIASAGLLEAQLQEAVADMVSPLEATRLRSRLADTMAELCGDMRAEMEARRARAARLAESTEKEQGFRVDEPTWRDKRETRGRSSAITDRASDDKHTTEVGVFAEDDTESADTLTERPGETLPSATPVETVAYDPLGERVVLVSGDTVLEDTQASPTEMGHGRPSAVRVRRGDSLRDGEVRRGSELSVGAGLGPQRRVKDPATGFNPVGNIAPRGPAEDLVAAPPRSLMHPADNIRLDGRATRPSLPRLEDSAPGERSRAWPWAVAAVLVAVAVVVSALAWGPFRASGTGHGPAEPAPSATVSEAPDPSPAAR